MRGFPSARLAARSAQLVLVATVCVLGLAPGSPVRVEAASATSESEAEWYGGLILEEEPVGYWRLGDESNQSVAADASGNDYDGAFGSEVSPAAAGIFEDDDAFEFAGSPTDDLEDRAVIVDEVAAFSFEGDFTVEAWVKTTGGDPLDNFYGQTIVATDAQFDRGWRVWIDGPAGDPGRVMAHLHGSSGADYYGPEIDVNDGDWHHVAVVFDRDYGAIVYVDGEEEQTAGVVEDTTPNASDLMIGSDTIVPSPFAGSIDELAVYDYALSEEDIDRHIGGPSCEELPQEPTVTLFAPTSLHANGADLDWSPYVETCNPQFGGYQVHRSRSEDFTPSAATLIASIEEVEVTAYRDTTAAADTTFYYKVVAGEEASEEHEVTLPEAGMATRLIQPGPGEGRDATIRLSKSSPNCNNEGASTELAVGSTASAIMRSLVRFDLRDVPTGASVEDATLSLWHPDELEHAGTVRIHRVTRDWREGPGDGTNGSCLGKGATWYEANGGVPWTEGGSFDSSVVDDLAASSSEPAGWHSFDVSGLAQAWVDAEHPNFGVLVKLASETAGSSCGTGECARWSYTAIDGAPAERPRLELVYEDETAAVVAPRVGVALPRAGATVSGVVPLAAAAGDDGRVAQVQFKIGSTIVASDDSAPFTASWDSNGVADGSHEARAIATDDAGNTTTSDPIAFTVDNSTPPTVTVDSFDEGFDEIVAAKGPAGYYRLNETDSELGLTLVQAGDASGNGNHGAYDGAYTLEAVGLLTGDSDAATTFHDDSTDGQVEIPSFTLGSDVTVEAWVEYSPLASNNDCNRLVSRDWGSTGGWALSVCRIADEQVAVWALDEGPGIASATAPVTPGALYLAGSYDGADLVLYVDGVELARAAASASADDSEPFLFAGDLAGDVTLDEVALYDVAVDAVDLRGHHDAGLGHGPPVKGTATISADATVGTARVDFFVDDALVGSDTSAPFDVSWNTLDPLQPVYDGQRQVTARAYGPTGKKGVSAPVAVVVGNSEHRAQLSSTVVPAQLAYDPEALTQETVKVDVTVLNTGKTIPASAKLHYYWYPAVGPREEPDLLDGGYEDIDQPIHPGDSDLFSFQVEPPELPDAYQAGEYVLCFDLVENSNGFASKGHKPLENPVRINMGLRDQLGLERWFQYEQEDLGGGMTHMLNVANGNSIVRFAPWSAPGRGLSTALSLTYNSLERKCHCGAGNNWSLALSSLTRLDQPLEIHNPPGNPPGSAAKWIRFTDGDGTTHEFTGFLDDDVVHWEPPPGVHLYLRQYPGEDPERAWALTRPDRVTFFYDEQGYPTFVRDRNGNELAFELTPPPHGEPQNIESQVTAVTDAGGNSFQLTYYGKPDRNHPQVGGRVKTITDHDGSELFFEYFDDGNLMRITERGAGLDADYAQLPDRTWTFSYTLKSDPTEPAEPEPEDRANPAPNTHNQSTALYSVIDPRGNETIFTYEGGAPSKDKWKLATRTNRADNVAEAPKPQTTFAYDIQNRVTTVSAPLGRVSEYHYDTNGSTTLLVDPAERETGLTWNADGKLVRLDEPGGGYREFDYNHNGYLTDQTILLDAGEDPDTLAHTELVYDDHPVDANDQNDRISELAELTNPRGHTWEFEYDANGNLERVTDPLEHETEYDWTLAGEHLGTLAKIVDASGHETVFGDYQEHGLPTEVSDAEGNTTTFEYTGDGLLRALKAPNEAGLSEGEERGFKTVFDYDAFHRLQTTSTPKTAAQINWTGVVYDPNGNVVRQIGRHTAAATFTGAGPLSETSYDPMDRPLVVTGPDRSHHPLLEETQLAYDAAGRLETVVSPRAAEIEPTPNAFTTALVYDELDRVISQIRYPKSGEANDAARTHFCYDPAGDLISITAPKAALAEPECGDPETEFTTRFTYDDGHRRLTSTDPQGRQTSLAYDANGNVIAETDAEGSTSERDFDQLDRLKESREPFITAALPEDLTASPRTLFTGYEYDPVGNLIEVASPRAFDAAGDENEDGYYITSYEYDDANRLVRTLLPVNDDYEQQIYAYRAYDPTGNLILTSLETSTHLDLETQDPLTELPEDEKTVIDYYRDGTIRTVDDPGSSVPATDKVFHDTLHRASGSVQCRLPGMPVDCSAPIRADQTTSRYDPDGQLIELIDKNQGRATYTYDLNNNLVEAHDARVTAAGRTQAVTAEWDGFDQLEKARRKANAEAAWRFTAYVYDLNGNLLGREDDGVEGDPGEPGRLHEFVYNQADWLTEQTDQGEDGTADDQLTVLTYFQTGWPKTRTVSRNSAAYAVKEKSQWDRFANGLTYTLTTRDGDDDVLEQHLASYLDDAGLYVNGNRTRDEFTQEGPTGAVCESCETTYEYDPRERLVKETSDRTGAEETSEFTLDDHGNVTCETKDNVQTGVVETGYTYGGNQQRTVMSGCPGTIVSRSIYDGEGNLDCVTTSAVGSDDPCPAPGAASLLADYVYDYLNRLESWRSYSSGAEQDVSRFEYDALGRPILQYQRKGPGGAWRTTELAYLGLSSDVFEEVQHAGETTSDPRITTKTYAYDPFGQRISLTTDPGPAAPEGSLAELEGTFTYGYDPHGNVTLLLDDEGGVQASYGYEAYGEPVDQLTEGDNESIDPEEAPDDALNPYRYSGKRQDSLSKSYDMGARRYHDASGRFLQQDLYLGALADLTLTLDPLTGNRYALAGGNPVGYVEFDGHGPIDEDGSVNKKAAARYSNGLTGQPQQASRTDIQSSGPGYGTSGFRNSGSCVQVGDANCSFDAWHTSTLDQRRSWLNRVDARYNLGSWLDAFHAAVEYFDTSQVFSSSDRIKLEDAGVLYVVSRGLAAQGGEITLDPSLQSFDASTKWRTFFEGLRSGSSNDSQLKHDWGVAETAGVEFGKTLGERSGIQWTDAQELVYSFFVEQGDSYRRSLITGGNVPFMPWRPSDPRRDREILLTGARLIESQLCTATSPGNPYPVNLC